MQIAQFNRFEIELPDDCVNNCSCQGKNDEAVEFWENKLDLSHIDPAKIRAELKEYGAWNKEELNDDLQNRRRLIWIAAHNLKEEMACAE